MRYSQLVRRVRRILHDETPYRYDDAQVRAIIAAWPATLSLGNRFRRELVLDAARRISEATNPPEGTR